MVTLMGVEDFKFIYLLASSFFVTNQIKKSEALMLLYSVISEPQCAVVRNVMESLSFNIHKP